MIATGILLPHLARAPWFLGERILVPTFVVQHVFPGSPRGGEDPRHRILNDAVYQFAPWEWEAWSNGSKARTLTVNGAFLGVVAHKGVGSLRLRYVPPGLRAGIYCLSGSLAALLAIAVAGRYRGRKSL